MPVTVADLVAKFRFDDRDFQRDMRRVEASLQQFSRKVAGTMTGAGRSPVDRQAAALLAETARAQSSLNTAMAGGSREAQQLASRFHLLTSAQRAEAVAAREALTAQREREGAARRLGDTLKSVGATMTAGVTAPLVALGVASVRSAAQMDSLKRGLTAVAGSTEEAERQLVELREVAKLPGLGFAEAIEGSTRLQAAGLSADLAKKSLLAFGNALATVGKGKAELDGVTLALTQITAKGKVTAEEINQIAERVPQIRVAMRAAFGTANTEALQKMGLTARQFIEGITRELSKLPRVTGGVQNAFENLGDVVKLALGEIGRNILPTLLPIVQKITTRLTEMTRQFAELPQPVRAFALGLAGVVAAAGPLIFIGGQLITSFRALTSLLPAVVTNLKAVGAALLAMPGWAKLAAAAVSLMVAAWSSDFLGIRTRITEFVQWAGPTLVDMWNYVKDETARIFAAMADSIKGFVKGIKDAWSGVGTGIMDAIMTPFRKLFEFIDQLPPQVKEGLQAAFKNTPLGKLFEIGQSGVEFGQRFAQYANLRNHMQETWDNSPLNPKNQRKPSPGPRPTPPDEAPVEKAKKLTPLEQEMLAIQAQLNAAQIKGTLIAKEYSPEIAELASQYRHAAADAAGFAKIIDLARVKADETLKSEEERARAMRSAAQLTAKQRQEQAIAAEQIARGVMPDTKAGGELRILELTRQFTKMSPALTKIIKEIAEAEAETAGWDARLKKATETSQQLKQVQENLNQTAEAGQRELAKIISPHNFRTGIFLWQELGIEFDDLTKEQQLLAHSIAQTAKEADQYRTRIELWRDAASGIHDVFSSAFQNIGEGFGGLVRSIHDGFKQMLLKMAADFVASQLTKTLMGFLGNVLGPGLGGFFSKGEAPLPAGWHAPMARAMGGPMMAGRPYLVGERGPELVLPRQSGTVISNRQLAAAGAGSSYTINVNVSGKDTDAARQNASAIAAEISRNLQRQERRNRGGA